MAQHTRNKCYLICRVETSSTRGGDEGEAERATNQLFCLKLQSCIRGGGGGRDTGVKCFDDAADAERCEVTPLRKTL